MGIVEKILKYQQEYGWRYTKDFLLYRYFIKYHLGKKYFPMDISKEEFQSQRQWEPDNPVKVSIVVPLYNTPMDFLQEMIQSVINQTYENWELCLADASDELQKEIEAAVEEYSRQDARIRYFKLPGNGGIAVNSNHGLARAEGDYIGLLDHDDLLHPSALYYVVKEINEYQADFIYTDELSFDQKPEKVQSVHLKPDFSPESFRCNNYVCHFSVFERSLLERAGMFRKEMDGSQDYDLFLRLTDLAGCVRHIPKVLYYWRCHAGSVASQAGVKPYTIEAGRKAIQEHLKRQNLAGKVYPSKEHPSFYKVAYVVSQELRICVLCEDSETTGWVKEHMKDVPWKKMVIDLSGGGSILSSMNWKQWDEVVFVRKGYIPKQKNGLWLKELLQCLQPAENMVAAPMVYLPDGRVYHAGYTYGTNISEKIRPLYQGLPSAEVSYMNRLCFRQNVSLLGGAVLAVKSSVIIKYLELQEGSACVLSDSNVFSDACWFGLCFAAKKQWGECVLTPYAFFERRSKHDGEYLLETAWEQPEWKSFLAQWQSCLEEPDPHGNPGMEVFGKYYFLW